MNHPCKRYMRLLRFFPILLMFFFFYPLIAENTVYEFGPKTDSVLVFTASASSDNQSTTATVQLRTFAEKLSTQTPDIHIIVAVTKNDISELPPGIPVRRYEGIKQLIQKLSAYAGAVVCIIDSGEAGGAKITAGTSAGTAPSWLLRSVHDNLRAENIPVDFYSNALVFHRLGWLPDDPALLPYNQAKIPAIKIETNADLTGFLSLLPAHINETMSNEWDEHYFIQKINKRLIIINERYIIWILISSSMLILLWLMLFSFLVGKKREQHIKDLIVLWWMPLYFFVINWIGFRLGTRIVELLFYLRFSSAEEAALFPLSALIVKYSFTFFFIFVFTAFNKFIPLPANRFIYGFMAHVFCLLNIFFFSFINLSFSIIFLAVYFISFAAYQFKHIILQILFIICLFLPLMPFVVHILLHRYYMFHIVFFTNLEPALVCVPVDLFLIRLSLSIDKLKKNTIRIPFHCTIAGIMFIAAVLWVWSMPVSENKHHDDVIIIQRITEDTGTVIKKYVGVDGKEDRLKDFDRQQEISAQESADDFLTLTTSLTNYFERSIGNLSINSPIRAEALSVEISSQTGVAIFEADQPFEQNSSGDTATFMSSPRPTLPFVIQFSGKKDADLTVKVMLWSSDNYFGIAPREKKTNGDSKRFLMEITKTVRLKAEADKK